MRNLTSRQKKMLGVYAMILAMAGDYLLGFGTFSTSSSPDAYMGMTFNVVPDWGIAVNPENHKEGYSFHLIGCPIAKHAKENGYEELLPHLCRTDHVLAEVLHARLIRTQTEILCRSNQPSGVYISG